MLPDRVSNPGPLTYESGALPIALRGPECQCCMTVMQQVSRCKPIFDQPLSISQTIVNGNFGKIDFFSNPLDKSIF